MFVGVCSRELGDGPSERQVSPLMCTCKRPTQSKVFTTWCMGQGEFKQKSLSQILFRRPSLQFPMRMFGDAFLRQPASRGQKLINQFNNIHLACSCGSAQNCVNVYSPFDAATGCFFTFLKLSSAMCCAVKVSKTERKREGGPLIARIGLQLPSGQGQLGE